MDIHEPKADFPFEQVTLSAPVAVAGGNHHMKYSLQGKPLYIQTPMCKVKHLDLSGNKRPFCDLMFTNENEEWIRWMEELEAHTCKYVFDRRESWFASDLDKADIENYFQSPLKIYKSGKYYVARTHIPVRLGKVSLKIYDDAEEEVDPETITEETDVLTIIQVNGIKCSARSFQVELELKQMLVLTPTNEFEKCLLLGSKKAAAAVPPPASPPSAASPPAAAAAEAVVVREEEEEEDEEEQKEEDEVLAEEKEDIVDEIELQVVDVGLDETEGAVEIKPRNEVFYAMYQEARKKAKVARAVALAAYLEAKHIKNTYDIQEDDDDDEEV